MERVQEPLMVCDFHPQKCSTSGSPSSTGARKAALAMLGSVKAQRKAHMLYYFFMTPKYNISSCLKFTKHHLCTTRILLYCLKLSNSSLIRQDPIRGKRKPSILVFPQPLPEINPNLTAQGLSLTQGAQQVQNKHGPCPSGCFTASLLPAAHPSHPIPSLPQKAPLCSQHWHRFLPYLLGSVHHTHPKCLFPARPWRPQSRWA